MWSHDDARLAHLGATLALLGVRLANLGARLAHLGARLAHLGACCRAILWSGEALGSRDGPRWSQDGAILRGLSRQSLVKLDASPGRHHSGMTSHSRPSPLSPERPGLNSARSCTCSTVARGPHHVAGRGLESLRDRAEEQRNQTVNPLGVGSSVVAAGSVCLAVLRRTGAGYSLAMVCGRPRRQPDVG